MLIGWFTCPGQKGTPHPQAPKCAKARMYKVPKALLDERRRGSRAESSVTLQGEVNDPAAKAAVASQLKGQLDDLEGQDLVDRETGKIKIRKPKKETKNMTDDEKLVHNFKGPIKKQLF